MKMRQRLGYGEVEREQGVDGGEDSFMKGIAKKGAHPQENVEIRREINSQRDDKKKAHIP